MSISATQLRRLFAKENLLFTPSYHIIAYMLNRFTVLPQHQPPPSKVQLLFSVAAYFQKIVDIHSFVGIITQQLSNSATQQLSNSATQQLSNSATQQLRRKVCLRPEKRVAFTFRQQHHYFSSIFADGTSSASVFTFTQKRYFAALGIFCALGMQRSCPCKVIITRSFYRNARQAVWFDSG